MGAVASNNVVSEGLVLCWDGANRVSYPATGSSLRDISSTYPDATIANATFMSGNGGYFDFDGSGDYIQLGSTDGDSFTDTDDMSLSIWIILRSDSNQGVIGRGSWSSLTNGWSLWEYGGLKFWSTDGSSEQYVRWNPASYPSTWTHCLVTRDMSSAVLKMYINGEVFDTETGLNDPLKTNNGLMVGKLQGTFWLDAALGPIHIYNRPLTHAQVLQNYNATKGRFGL